MAASSKLKVMVLAGGPDRERPVSLISGQQVAEALTARGHDVRLRDILPDDLAALDEFEQWRGEAIFPALHGSWGEGGGLQQVLDRRGLPYVGCTAAAADLCMDKHRTKLALQKAGLSTPAFDLLTESRPLNLQPPLVLKPLREGSSIDIAICRDADALYRASRELLPRYGRLLAEQFIAGIEVTVGVIGEAATPRRETALPPVQIIAASEFYDYQAKYLRDDTRYLFDLPLAADAIACLKEAAVRAHRACGCRHLSRVDFIVDPAGRPWILEINTIPGFTTHSLLPKAAAHAGIAWEDLVERLVRLALAPTAKSSAA